MANFSLWALLPLIYSVCTAVGLWVVYGIAVYNENITPLSSEYRRRNGSLYPPYISIAGNFPPASCIFSGVMNLAGFVGSIIAILRYLQLKNKIDKRCLFCVNIVSLVFFFIGCFGMTLVGNFQANVHNAGAIMVFGLGALFCWMQSCLTMRVNLKNEGMMVAIARYLLSAVITVLIIPYFVLMSQRHHMHASRCQWAFVMLFLVFIGTFAIEFRHSSFWMECEDVPA